MAPEDQIIEEQPEALPDLEIEMREQIDEALAALEKRRVGYAVLQDYMDGDHNLVYASERFKKVYGSLFEALCENLCPVVVDVAADRLSISGFALPSATISEEEVSETPEGEIPEAQSVEDDAGDQFAEVIDAFMEAQNFPVLEDDIHEESLAMGDAYIIVWKDGDTVTLHPQKAAWCTVVTDSLNGDVLAGIKLVKPDEDKPTTLVYIYYKDRVEAFQIGNRLSLQNAVPYGPGYKQAHTFGVVPMVHFKVGGALAAFGRSTIEDVIPLQDALNKAIDDLLVGSEFHAFPQRWATGIQLKRDPITGDVINPFDKSGGVWYTEGEGARFGNFPQASLKDMLETIESFEQMIARVSATPVHYFSPMTGYPSGESLRVSEHRLTSKVGKLQRRFSVPWLSVLKIALKIDTSGLEPTWEDLAPVNEKEQVEIALAKQEAGVPIVQTLVEMGYTEAQARSFAEQSKAEKQTAGAALLKAWEAAGGGVQGEGDGDDPSEGVGFGAE